MRAKTTRSRGLRHIGPLPDRLAGKDVLIVDDILDSGRTLAHLLKACRPCGRAACESVCCSASNSRLRHRPEADFVGFDVPNRFLIGYGLDYDGLYRNLPDVCALPARTSRRGPTHDTDQRLLRNLWSARHRRRCGSAARKT